MKKMVLITCLVLTATINVFGQRFSLTGFAGYTFADDFSINGYSGTLKDNWHYGGGVEFMIHPLYGAEILYQAQSTEAVLYNYYTQDYTDDVTISYIMGGGVRYIPFMRGRIMPYGGLNVGVGIVDYSNDTRTCFAWGAKIGLKVKASERIAFKAQAQLYSMVNAVSASFWFVPGASGISFSGYSTVYQYGFTAGISIGI